MDGAAHDDERACTVVADERILPSARRIARFAADLEDEELCDFFADAQLLHQRIYLCGVAGFSLAVGSIVVAAGCKQDQ